MYYEWLLSILTSPEWITAIGTVFLGFVTFLAVIVALFKEDLLRPKIKIGIGNDVSYTIDNYITPMGRLFRIKIVNIGKSVARNCQVKMLSVKDKEGKNVLDKNEPDILKWAGSPRDMRFRVNPVGNIDSVNDINKLPPIFREDKNITPRGGSEFCDLFRVDAKKNIVFSSSGERSFVCEEEGRYFVLIEISGDNFKPTIKEIEIYTPFSIDKDSIIFTAGVVGVRNIS